MCRLTSRIASSHSACTFTWRQSVCGYTSGLLQFLTKYQDLKRRICNRSTCIDVMKCIRLIVTITVWSRWSVCRQLNVLSDSPIVRIDSGDKSVKGTAWSAAVLVCSGREVFSLIEHAVAKAASLSGEARPRVEKQLPDSLNYFGWCTWDAFYSSVSAKVRFRRDLLSKRNEKNLFSQPCVSAA
jgi:hypothetical protein